MARPLVAERPLPLRRSDPPVTAGKRPALVGVRAPLPPVASVAALWAARWAGDMNN